MITGMSLFHGNKTAANIGTSFWNIRLVTEIF